MSHPVQSCWALLDFLIDRWISLKGSKSRLKLRLRGGRPRAEVSMKNVLQYSVRFKSTMANWGRLLSASDSSSFFLCAQRSSIYDLWRKQTFMIAMISTVINRTDVIRTTVVEPDAVWSPTVGSALWKVVERRCWAGCRTIL